MTVLHVYVDLTGNETTISVLSEKEFRKMPSPQQQACDFPIQREL